MQPFAVNPDVGLWERNAVLNGRNTHYVTGENEGTLSIKTVLNGVGHWVTPTSRYRVEPGSYLVLTSGQRYGVEIRSSEPVETFCAFFRPGFMERVLEGLDSTWDELLEGENPVTEMGFYERLSPSDDLVGDHMLGLRNVVKGGQQSELEAEEAMIRLAESLLREHLCARRQRDRLDLAKPSTREEIYRRLNLARDYILGHLDSSLDLETIAQNACLSPFHFHRLFKASFGVTPHEFLVEQRLSKARRLLARSSQSITEIGWAVGYETPAAFSKFFSKSTGTSPTAYRQRSI
jgi:AraC family transcriptional regulator